MFEIISSPIVVDEVIKNVMHANAGAIVTFLGTVREMTGEKKTIYLYYEAYQSMARAKLAQIGQEVKQQWPGTKIAIIHRIGRLEIGDVAVAIAVSSSHRNDAYEANRYAIDRIKELVPIWKKEHWEDGEMWVGNQQGTISYASGNKEVMEE